MYFSLKETLEFLSTNSKNGVWEYDDISEADTTVFCSYFSNNSDENDIYIVLSNPTGKSDIDLQGNVTDTDNEDGIPDKFSTCIMKVNLAKLNISNFDELGNAIKRYRL
ncbi:hypothetical protein F341_030 [Campylobacter phage F341]|uniref:Uncharacterized protein n=3 Tax=Fletchervirus TaxID=1636618 RepID=J9SUB3_9CAUD|nr:hypothetical protein D302_gp107 [Campylobacter phage CP30A]YP_009597167.1 hypothetical protein FDH13_gp056 [Campylobacter phage vB_CjeM_Los1]QPX62992.1 hypothetical protein F336_034 [Campylobacter phage F336]WJZ70130.1 hypothetical protein F341_030 [Campylobacter phage F341]AFR52419.1 hypothetical protein [Campylobacter phage CP30A]AOT25877.1 hypothetical protein LOS1_00056 [Campylobacter phage vB_CjeM_Los1]